MSVDDFIEELINERLGFTCGAFDPIHFGHIRMLKEAREQCDRLVVGLHVDPSVERPSKGKPCQTWEQRKEVLESIRYVDVVVPYLTEEDLLIYLYFLDPAVRIIGADYEGKTFTGSDLGIPLYYNRRDHDFSATQYREALANSWLEQKERAK